MKYTIEFVDKISHVDEDKMTKDLVAYESALEIDVNYKKLSVVLKGLVQFHGFYNPKFISSPR
jgi:hypothetical protein